MLGRASCVKMVGMAEVGHQLVWMGWQSIQIVGASACVIFILLQKIQKMAKCTFWFRLTQVVPDKVQRAAKWLCVYVCDSGFLWLSTQKLYEFFTYLLSHSSTSKCKKVEFHDLRTCPVAAVNA